MVNGNCVAHYSCSPNSVPTARLARFGGHEACTYNAFTCAASFKKPFRESALQVQLTSSTGEGTEGAQTPGVFSNKTLSRSAGSH